MPVCLCRSVGWSVGQEMKSGIDCKFFFLPMQQFRPTNSLRDFDSRFEQWWLYPEGELQRRGEEMRAGSSSLGGGTEWLMVGSLSKGKLGSGIDWDEWLGSATVGRNPSRSAGPGPKVAGPMSIPGADPPYPPLAHLGN